MTAVGDAPARRNGIALLVNVKSLGEGGAVKHTAFGNIIALGTDALVLESSREYGVGDALIINLVFPGLQRIENPHTALECIVRHVRDDNNMHYDATIERADESARQRLLQYLSKPRPGKLA